MTNDESHGGARAEVPEVCRLGVLRSNSNGRYPVRHSSFRFRHSSFVIRHCAAICLLITLFSGCAGYRLGPSGGQTAGARSIQINPFVNQTIEPRLVEALTHALRKQIQQDGTFRLNTHNDGDIVVTGAIVRYERESISVNAGDALTPRDYRITIVARVTARERATGKVLLDRELLGRTEVRAGADLFSAERQGIPLAADFLASSATSLLADGPW